MAAAPDLWVIETPPGTVRMNINQAHLAPTGQDIAEWQGMISVTLKPGAVIELFCEGMGIAGFQISDDGKGFSGWDDPRTTFFHKGVNERET